MKGGVFLAVLISLSAFGTVVNAQTSYWCDGGEQQERLYHSLNSLRYNEDFKTWANHTGWAVTVQTCSPVVVGNAVLTNCTALSEEGQYDCQGPAVTFGEPVREALTVYTCVPMELEETTVYNCTIVEQECTATVYSTGDRVCACQWYGVDCDSTEKLIELDLSNNGMSIMIPDLFFDDIYASIDLSKNLIYGELSSRATGLSSLVTMDLSKNYLHGQLPNLGKLSNLTYLDIKKNYLAGFYPDFLVTPDDYWSDIELHFSDNMFWCPAPSWCLPPPTGNGECSTCEDLPSQDGCSEESQYACDESLVCCYTESWDSACVELATDAGKLCTSPSFNWLLFSVCILAVVIIIFIGAVVAMLLTRRGQNFLVMFTRNKKNLVVMDDEDEDENGLYDIYPDEY